MKQIKTELLFWVYDNENINEGSATSYATLRFFELVQVTFFVWKIFVFWNVDHSDNDVNSVLRNEMNWNGSL